MEELGPKFYDILNIFDELLREQANNSTNIEDILKETRLFLDDLTSKHIKLSSRDIIEEKETINIDLTKPIRSTISKTIPKVTNKSNKHKPNIINTFPSTNGLVQTPKPQALLQHKSINNTIKIESSKPWIPMMPDLPIIPNVKILQPVNIDSNDRYFEIILKSSRLDGNDEYIIEKLYENFDRLYEPRYMKTVIVKIGVIKRTHDNVLYLHGLIRFGYNVSNRVTAGMKCKDNEIKSMSDGRKHIREYEKKCITLGNGPKNITKRDDITIIYNLITNDIDSDPKLDTFLI